VIIVASRIVDIHVLSFCLAEICNCVKRSQLESSTRRDGGLRCNKTDDIIFERLIRKKISKAEAIWELLLDINL
jgi:hypothetical protein